MSHDILLSSITRNPKQPRETFPEEHIEGLAASIKKRGLMQPITVRPWRGKYQIVAGECRFRAHVQLGAKTIKADVVDVDDNEMQLRAVVENLQRRDLDPMEEARAYKSLLDSGYTADDIVRELGLRSTAKIHQRLSLLDLTPQIQKLTASGQLSVATAWGIAQAPQQHQSRLVHEIDHGRLRTAEQVRAAGRALRDAAAQQDAFMDAPRVSEHDMAGCKRLEGKVEMIVTMINAGFKDGECVARSRVSPDRVKLVADRIALIRKHLLQMENDLRRVATQTEMILEMAS